MALKVAVIGLGLFGREIAISLSRRGVSVLAVDYHEEHVEAIKEHVDQAMILDSTDETALYEARINEFPVAVCAIGNQHMEDSIMTVALLHQLEVPQILARAVTSLHSRILRQVGATEVVNPEEAMGQRVAYRIASPGIHEVLSIGEGVCVAEIPIPPSFIGKNLVELGVRVKYGVNVIGVNRIPARKGETSADNGTTKRKLVLNLNPQEQFLSDDILVVIGSEENVKRISGLG